MSELEFGETLITNDDLDWFLKIRTRCSDLGIKVSFFTKKEDGSISVKLCDIISSEEE